MKTIKKAFKLITLLSIIIGCGISSNSSDDFSTQKPQFNLSINGFDFNIIGLDAKFILPKVVKLYEPMENITFKIEVAQETDAPITVRLVNNHNNDIIAEKTYLLNKNEKGLFNTSVKGSYRIEVELKDFKDAIHIGVMKSNERANDPTFYWGVETRLARVLNWHRYVCFPNTTQEETYNIYLSLIDYLGVNYIRGGSGLKAIYPSAADENFDNTDKVLKDVIKRGITFNWVIADTPDYAYTISSNGEKIPSTSQYIVFLEKIAARYENYAGKIIYEIENEPNFYTFWKGKREEYFEHYEKVAGTIKNININNIVTNGGLILARSNWNNTLDINYKPYWINFKKNIEAKKMNYIGLHGHGKFYEMSQAYLALLENSQIRYDKMIINESGIKSENWDEQAENVMAKLIFAKANKFRGFSLYALVRDYHDDPNYAIVTNNVEPKPLFLQYMTAIQMINNTVPQKVDYLDDGIAALFENASQEVYVFVNKTPENFNASISGYTYYDAYGNTGLHAMDTKVKYYIKTK